MALAALTTEERQQLILSVGTHRGERHLSPVEVATLIDQAIRAGDSMTDIAKAVSLDGTSQIGRFRSLLRLPSDVQHLIDWGKSDETLAFTSAFELSRLDDPADQRLAVQAVLEHGLTTSEVRQLVQARKRSGKAMDECVSSVLRMRPQVEVRHVFIGAVLDEGLRARLKHYTQQRRDEIFKALLSTALPMAQASGRLGAERFTVVGGEALGKVVKSQKESLEADINEALLTAVKRK